jgi:hypothetical protein
MIKQVSDVSQKALEVLKYVRQMLNEGNKEAALSISLISLILFSNREIV